MGVFGLVPSSGVLAPGSDWGGVLLFTDFDFSASDVEKRKSHEGFYVMKRSFTLNEETQTVERETSNQKVMGSIHTLAAHSLLVRSVSGQCEQLRKKLWFLHLLSVWQHIKMSEISLRTLQRENLVPNDQC